MSNIYSSKREGGDKYHHNHLLRVTTNEEGTNTTTIPCYELPPMRRRGQIPPQSSDTCYHHGEGRDKYHHNPLLRVTINEKEGTNTTTILCYILQPMRRRGQIPPQFSATSYNQWEGGEKCHHNSLLHLTTNEKEGTNTTTIPCYFLPPMRRRGQIPPQSTARCYHHGEGRDKYHHNPLLRVTTNEKEGSNTTTIHC